MKRYLIAGLLAVAMPSLADAQAPVPMVGWSVSSGHSTSGSKICTLYDVFGRHNALAWVADAANSPQRFTLLFDDGDAPPRATILVSQLTVATHGSRSLSIPGTIRFGQFRSSVEPQIMDPLLHLIVAKRSMTVALGKESPVPVNLMGSADAAQQMLDCEQAEHIAQLPTGPVRLAVAREHIARRRTGHVEVAVAREHRVQLPKAHVRVAVEREHRNQLTKGPVRLAQADRPHRARRSPEAAPVASIPIVAVALPSLRPAPAEPMSAPPAIAVTPSVAEPSVVAAAPLPAPLPAATPVAPPMPPPAITAAPVLPAPAVATAAPVPAPATTAAAVTPEPAVAAATPSSASSLATAEQLALNDTLLLAKAIEDQFLAILQDGKISYENTSDKELSLGARATRATDLCTLLGNDKEAIEWTGTISSVDSSQGQRVLAVKLADGVTVGTMRSGVADHTDVPTIDPASDLFKTMSQMHVGERVRFSGQFFPSSADCIKETSPSESGSMTAPNFAITFTSVDAQH